MAIVTGPDGGRPALCGPDARILGVRRADATEGITRPKREKPPPGLGNEVPGDG